MEGQRLADALLERALSLLYADDAVREDEPEAVALLRQGAELGHPGCQWQLGRCLADARDDEAAVLWFRKAAGSGLADAQFFLASHLVAGRGVAPDPDEAILLYRAAASQGHMAAASTLARMLASRGPRFAPEAAALYRVAALLGNECSAFDLAMCYAHGKGVDVDLAEAVRWLHAAADAGHSYARLYLGMYYRDGLGVAKDESRAFQWFLDLAERQRFPQAMGQVGMCYAGGCGVPASARDAVAWFRKGAEAEDPDALFGLGLYLLDGVDGVLDMNECEAASLFAAAAVQGHAEAQYRLAVCFECGVGVGEDQTQAVHWYEAAAAQGLVDAMCNLGVCFMYARGVRENKQEAFRLFHESARLAHAPAEFNMGLCYATGAGVDQSDVHAAQWFRVAALNDYPRAMHRLAAALEAGCGVPKDVAQAAYWYCAAAAAPGGPRIARSCVKRLVRTGDLGVLFVIGNAPLELPPKLENIVKRARCVRRRSSERARRAVLCWLWSRLLPRDAALIIARLVYDSRRDPALWAVALDDAPAHVGRSCSLC